MKKQVFQSVFKSFASTDSGEGGDMKISAGSVGLPNNQLDDKAVSSILGTVFTWGSVLALIMIVVGGILYITSSDDETRLRRAKATITYSVVGFALMILSLAIVKFVEGAF